MNQIKTFTFSHSLWSPFVVEHSIPVYPPLKFSAEYKYKILHMKCTGMSLRIGRPSTRNASYFRRSRCQMPPKRGQRHSEPSNQRFCWPRWRCKGFLSDWGVRQHLDRNTSPYSWCQTPRSRRHRPTSCHTNLNVGKNQLNALVGIIGMQVWML